MDKKSKKERLFTSNARLTFSAAPAAQPATDAPSGTEVPSETAGVVRGYAIVWNQLSSDRFAADGSTYKVRIIPGSPVFTNPCLAYREHDGRLLIGNTANGTLRFLDPDQIGLPVEIQLPNNYEGQGTAVLIRDGYLNGMSFAMMNGFEQCYASEENGVKVLNCTKFTVNEVSVCADPAFSATSVKPADDDDDDDDDEDDKDDKDEDYDGEEEDVEMSNRKKEARMEWAKVERIKLDMLRTK